jgi:thiamine biosynthesis lipoprotein ApbE
MKGAWVVERCLRISEENDGSFDMAVRMAMLLYDYGWMMTWPLNAGIDHDVSLWI